MMTRMPMRSVRPATETCRTGRVPMRLPHTAFEGMAAIQGEAICQAQST